MSVTSQGYPVPATPCHVVEIEEQSVAFCPSMLCIREHVQSGGCCTDACSAGQAEVQEKAVEPPEKEPADGDRGGEAPKREQVAKQQATRLPRISVTDRISFVVPLRVNNNELPRAMGLIGSIMKNASPRLIHTMFIIVPDDEAEYFRAGAQGYRLQMLAKLAIAELVETTYYVTVDA
eukprot:gene30726-38480_t